MASLGDTGLANVVLRTWAAHLTGLLVDDRPQMLVVFIGANDDQGLYVDGAAAEPGTPGWTAGYRQRVDEILREATSTGVSVVWVGMPPMADALALNAAVESENQIYQQETETFPGTLYVSSTGVLGNVVGLYESTGVDGSGVPVSLRTEDGVHLTPAGSALLAGTVIDAIDQRRRAFAQATKYLAWGWWQTIAVVVCSGSSWKPSLTSTPMRPPSRSSTTLALSSRSGQAG